MIFGYLEPLGKECEAFIPEQKHQSSQLKQAHVCHRGADLVPKKQELFQHGNLNSMLC